MPEVRAVAKNIGASPKRIRPIANLVRGKKVEDAIQQLKFLTSPWANVISKVIKSAAANAENNLMMNIANLKITGVLIDGGPVLKRFKPHARGRVGNIRKRSSHVTITVDEELN